MNPKEGSKEGQDEFALHMCGQDGFFLDLGCADPIYHNNTYALEQAGWKGILFDKQVNAERAKLVRVAPVFQMDLSRQSIRGVLESLRAPKIIDFVSFDVDDATLPAIELFPWDEYQVRAMCFEHDLYCGPVERKQAMKKKLEPLGGYDVLAEDVCFEAEGSGEAMRFEDWWINTRLFQPNEYAGHFTRGFLWQEVLEQLRIK